MCRRAWLLKLGGELVRVYIVRRWPNGDVLLKTFPVCSMYMHVGRPDGTIKGDDWGYRWWVNTPWRDYPDMPPVESPKS